ncbi:RING-finger domain-containing protein [Phanerochaete sordida]|uniref:RING-finger domain-containing protein n=1 Tax=Phanerochaete sordida TaxID=48140 RepID=A0A9P3G511_9APHY|nr:RING-finger domain-containing protein [Phanerochaete sordida]
MSTVPVSSGIPTPKRNTKMPANSLDHLLNFSLPPRQSQQYQNHPRRRKPGTPAAVWNRERFVNAQYRFLMNPSGDYTVHFADPDIYFHWRDILQVIVPRASAASLAFSGESSQPDEGSTACPICLSPPTAPRMTKCGHIFCFPCILHYLNTSDIPKSVRCPICLDTVNERELKVVKWIDAPTSSSVEEDEHDPPTASSSSATADNGLSSRPRPGSTLRMRLIQRPQISTLALPRSSSWPSDLLLPLQAPFHFLPDVYHFAKFMLATPAALISDLTKDLDELATERRMLASMKDDLGVAFVDAAEAKVRHQMQKAAALENLHLKHSIDAAYNALHHIEDRATLNQAKERESDTHSAPPEDVPDAFLASQPSAFTSPSTTAEPQPSFTNKRDAKRRKNVNPPPPTSSYYFYQAASGMPIFLHPLDIKILLSYFNSYAAFPDTISVPIESYTESTVNDDLRKRCKYLSHLPAGADVAFVEVDLEPVVGQDGLKNFERPLANRRTRRKERDRKDDKARARAEERERERVVENWNELTRHHVDSYIPPPAARDPSPVPDFNDFPGTGEERRPRLETLPASGAWGARSFASAAQHPNSGALIAPQRQPRQRQTNSRDQDTDEWDLDLMFHEVDQRAGRGGGKRKGNRMVVLGGGGGRRR